MGLSWSFWPRRQSCSQWPRYRRTSYEGEFDSRRENIGLYLLLLLDYQRAVDEFETHCDHLRVLTDENHILRDQLQGSNKRHLADSEKIQRQQQLLCEARDEATSSAEHHHQELHTLYSKLNSLQMNHNTLRDEEVLDQMRRLNLNLESWVRSNFKDVTKLSTAFQHSHGFPSTSPQRRAQIQAYVTNLVYRLIFAPTWFGVENEQCEGLLRELEAGVQSHCSEAMVHSWIVATAVSIENISHFNQEAIFAQIVECVEDQLSTVSPTEAETRQRQLRRFLEKCAALKNTLGRQHEAFAFHCSPPGGNLSAQYMTFVGGDGQSATKVRLCLWPAIMKGTQGGGYQILEPELVWTTDG
ncbi:hypothetical protein BDW59DRAFT_162491 [Aspergillus cavernicola]|uniref:Uncharacterized protein n=1 Tax=Aspergillus cavernicola TaxID=176166 RepID=A0ABR4IAS3_9EURO